MFNCLFSSSCSGVLHQACHGPSGSVVIFASDLERLQQQVRLLADSHWDSLLVAGACVGSRNAFTRLIYIKRMCSYAKRQAPPSTTAPVRSWSGGATGSAPFRFIIILPILGLERNRCCGCATGCVKSKVFLLQPICFGRGGHVQRREFILWRGSCQLLAQLNTICKWLDSTFDAVNVTSMLSLSGSSCKGRSCIAHLEGT